MVAEFERSREPIQYEAASVPKKKNRAISSIDAVLEVSAENIVGLYLAEAGRWPLLSADDEQRLFVQIESAKKAERRLKIPELSDEERQEKQELIKEGEQAKGIVTNCNLRWVVSVAKKYLDWGIPLLDLIQEGNLGLLKAVDKFDVRLGWRFSTYATYWVRQFITRALDNQSRIVRLPVHIHERLGRVLKAARCLEQELGGEPTTTQIAERIGLDSEQVDLILKVSKWSLSLDEPESNEEMRCRESFADESSPDPVEETIRHQLKQAMKEALMSLPEREKRVLEMRFGLNDGKPRTLEEIGQKFGFTRERIRQIEKEAMARLRQPDRKRRLEPFR